MAVPIEEANVTYEDLADLEREFDDVETEIIRRQDALTKPLYEKRQKVIAKIPNFWPLVFEQAPQDIDQYIQPSDSAVLLSSLTSISVSRFEIEDGADGDPRSIAIRMDFAENDYFEDRVLEKKFWYRHSKDGSASLVSEPVPIKWKAGKDLTQGMLDLVVKVWEQEKNQTQTNGDSKKAKKAQEWTPDQKALREKIQVTGLGGVSFFCWFGYRGEDISAEESRLAIEKVKKERAQRASGEAPELKAVEEDDEEDEDEEMLPFEIFPDGDELAVAISDELWPNAIKYFTQAQEADGISDVDFEEDDEDDMDEEDDGEDDGEANSKEPPLKKRKA
ncbi:nucleosome assembly protein [Biscogniauxia mediterranea]|nr:nucleosome assembly protein [Biscogniauxia mediterranea]